MDLMPTLLMAIWRESSEFWTSGMAVVAARVVMGVLKMVLFNGNRGLRPLLFKSYHSRQKCSTIT